MDLLIVVWSFTLDTKTHVFGVVTHVFRDIRETCFSVSTAQIRDVRQVFTRTFSPDNLLLVGSSRLEEHVSKLGPHNCAEQESAGQDECYEEGHAQSAAQEE